ncbi:homoserine kinase [Mesorhizobium sp. CAU 1741]|uniref:homoserine kinase n=1 Tax=Mesorhizobium sp. CAU 1741 TaxID=3140366 RepID=UPI00325BA1BA
MAVFTDITELELGAFLRGYDVGELLSYKGIAEGTENSNFIIHTSAGSYILTLYEKRVEKADLPFFLGLMEHLAERGVSCPLPVRQRGGEMIGELAGRPAAIITFLEGMWPRRPTAVHCRELGAALAKLHLAGADFPLSRPNALSLAGWRTLWDGCRERADEVEQGLGDEVAADFSTLEAEWPNDLPSGVIHADLFPDNVFFLGDRLSGLIDFYFACNDFFAYDVATCLNAWCFERDHAFNLTKGTALLAGYQSVRALAPREVEALPMLCRGSALRFMLTRLYDWLNGPDGALVQKRDPLEYVRKMRFHRQVGSAVEYGLKQP